MEIATTPLEDLIKALEEERIKRQLDHGAFSELLGISESYWSMLRTGKRKPNLGILTTFMQKLPEITPEVTIYIMRQGNDDGEGKVSKKTGGKNPRSYIDVSQPPKNARKPSKNAAGG